MLCFTNTACDNLRSKGLDNVHTFDSYYHKSEFKNIPDDIKKVQVDEFSMAHMGCLTMLYYSKLQRPDLVIQFYGDPNQCKQVHERHIEYLNHNHIL